MKLEIADIDVNLFKSRKKEDNCESYIRKLFGSSSCPSLQLVGRVAGLLVKVNKNRERATPSPDMQRCAKEKYKLVYQVFARAHNTQHMGPIDATLMLAHYSECSQHQETRILRSPLS